MTKYGFIYEFIVSCSSHFANQLAISEEQIRQMFLKKTSLPQKKSVCLKQSKCK